MGQPAVVHERTGRLAGWAAGDGSILEDVESHGAAVRTRFGSRVIGWSSLAARPGRTNMEETRAAMMQVVEGRCLEVLAGCVCCVCAGSIYSVRRPGRGESRSIIIYLVIYRSTREYVPATGIASFIEKTMTRLDCMKQTRRKEQPG